MHLLHFYCASCDCRYYIDHYNTDQKFKFKVDETTGVVVIRDQLDADVARNFNLHILAIDEGKICRLCNLSGFLVLNY